jgi:hypothetical protein
MEHLVDADTCQTRSNAGHLGKAGLIKIRWTPFKRDGGSGKEWPGHSEGQPRKILTLINSIWSELEDLSNA